MLTLGDLIFDKVRVTNNKVIVDVTKDDFAQLGLSGEDYEKMLKEVIDINHWNDTIKEKIDMATALEVSRAKYQQEKPNLNK